MRSRRMLKPGMLGGHLMRRKGQSMEFRDYATYQRGDDVRHIDWRASARHGRPEDLLVRNFVAEEQLKILVSLDNRPSMTLPENVSKLQHALWLAEALGIMTAPFGDKLAIHRLWGRQNEGVVELTPGRPKLTHRERAMLTAVDPDSAVLNLPALRKQLEPTVIWIIVSDFYNDDSAALKKLGRETAKAKDGLRWVILVDIDSWPHEKAVLGSGSRKIEGPGVSASETEYVLDDDVYRGLEQTIRDHKIDLFRRLGNHPVDRAGWAWPAQAEMDHADVFRGLFLGEPLLQRIFMRDA